MVTPIKISNLDQPKEPFKKALFPINPFFHFQAVNADEFIEKVKSVPREPQNDRFLWGTRSKCDKYLCEDIEEWITDWYKEKKNIEIN